MSDKNVMALTDEMATAIWSGSTASIAGLQEKIDEPAAATVVPLAQTIPTLPPDDKVIDSTTATPVNDDDVSKAFAGDLEDEDVDDTQVQATQTQTQSKAGRKTTDLVAVVNQLVEDGDL